MQHGLRTLAFCKTRKLCELVTAYTRETLRSTAPHLAQVLYHYKIHCLAHSQRLPCLQPVELESDCLFDLLQELPTEVEKFTEMVVQSISVYRAGYSPAERRAIEQALFRGDLWAVAATNALELGVDVGSLDATLHLGFPGTRLFHIQFIAFHHNNQYL